MRITILGATGLLGKALMREATGTNSSDSVPKTATSVIRKMFQSCCKKAGPTGSFLLLHIPTSTDAKLILIKPSCELPWSGECCGGCQTVWLRLLFVSTDYVFDGTKKAPYTTGDPRSPCSVYGKSKAEAEERIGHSLPESCIVRTSWLFGAGGKCFPDTILKLAATRSELEVVGDQRGSPTYAIDLAHALIGLCHENARGIVHATNLGECSWYEFAREIVAKSGSRTVVKETSSDKFVRPAPRPKYSALSPESLQSYGIVMPDWRDALQRYLAERTADVASR